MTRKLFLKLTLLFLSLTSLALFCLSYAGGEPAGGYVPGGPVTLPSGGWYNFSAHTQNSASYLHFKKGHIFLFTASIEPTQKVDQWQLRSRGDPRIEITLASPTPNPRFHLWSGRYGHTSVTQWLTGRGLISLAKTYPATIYVFDIPLLWPLLLSASLLTFLQIRDTRKKRRLLLQNLCPTCHYNLHAHPPGSTCPECGTPVPTPATP